MLTNYDARAVAELMGIAFRQSPTGFPEPRADSAGEIGPTMIGREHDCDVIIHVTGVTWSKTIGAEAANERVSPPTSDLIERAVEKGLPRATLRHLAEWLADGDKAKASMLEQRVVPKTTLERRGARLSPQESERTERIARLSVHARRALGTEAEARDFMTTAHPGLDGRSPADAARTDLGARRAEQILNALEYGLAL